jgi:tetratricopeptide (TPR) repeat protein/transcriptional regulator with XRE-family HTH domain
MRQPDDEPASFGTLLKTFRKRRRLTQQHLAEAIGTHRLTIIRWEEGDFLPASRTMVLELAQHLHLDEQEIRQLLEASLTALAPHWHVPLRRNPFFTGREEILETLHTHLSTDHGVALTQTYALHGLGGVGKTQLALEYVYRHALEYSTVFWIEAETEETVISSLLRLAEALQLPERKEGDQQRVVAAVQRWLSSHSGWLLIWDNLEDLDLLSRLMPTPPRQGAILLTTRCQALGTLAWGMDVAPMAQEEGVLFILRRAKRLSPEAIEEQVQHLATRRSDEYTTARALVTLMGGLPLALDQAGAYIEETGCSLAAYLQCYQQQCLHLLDRRGMVHGDHPLSVAATFELACQRVAQRNPAALELLRCCACLYPDAIPEDLLLGGTDHLGPVLGPIVADVSRFDEALAMLRTFSLVQRQPETHTLSLHRLVQVIVQGALSEQERVTLQLRLVHLLNAAFPETKATTYFQIETWKLREQLLPHVLTCLAAIPEPFQDQEVAGVLLKAAGYLKERGQWAQAERLGQRAVFLFEHLLGPEHPQVGSSLYFLAMLYHVQGKYEQAERLLQRALRIQEQAWGPDHPEVADLLSSIASIYHRQGRYGQGEALCQRALRIQEQALGETHPDLVYSLSVLGILYTDQENYKQAASMIQRVLQIYEQTLGPDHPDLSCSLNNLGLVYINQGKYELAEPLCRRAVILAEHGWGAEHPNVATLLETLATLYREMGQDEQAKPLYQRALQITEQARGPDHPFVAFFLHGLALISQKQGEDDEAESLYQRALSLSEQQLGQNHPQTAQTLHDLALFRKSQGNLHEARSFAERALHIREQALGNAHSHTTASQSLVVQLQAEQQPVQEGTPFPCGEEEHSDHSSTVHLGKKTSLSSQEMSSGFPSEGDYPRDTR